MQVACQLLTLFTAYRQRSLFYITINCSAVLQSQPETLSRKQNKIEQEQKPCWCEVVRPIARKTWRIIGQPFISIKIEPATAYPLIVGVVLAMPD